MGWQPVPSSGESLEELEQFLLDRAMEHDTPSLLFHQAVEFLISAKTERPGCPHTGRPCLGYDRARVLMDKHLGLDPHQLRHSAATHLGEQKVPLQLIMAKTRHRNPRTAMRYTRPGSEAVAEITGILAPPRPAPPHTLTRRSASEKAFGIQRNELRHSTTGS